MLGGQRIARVQGALQPCDLRLLQFGDAEIFDSCGDGQLIDRTWVLLAQTRVNVQDRSAREVREEDLVKTSLAPEFGGQARDHVGRCVHQNALVLFLQPGQEVAQKT